MTSNKFGKRLRLYLTGVGLGILAVIVIFGERTRLLTDWLPGNQVKKAIATSTWELNAADSCILFTCLKFPALNKDSLLQDAEVLFSESRKEDSELRSYVLKNEAFKIQSFNVEFINDSTIQFAAWKLNEEDANCPCF